MPDVVLSPAADGASQQWTRSPSGTPAFIILADYGQETDDLSTMLQIGSEGSKFLMVSESQPDIPPVRLVAWVGTRLRYSRGAAGSGTAGIAGLVKSAGVEAQTPGSRSMPPGDNDWRWADPSLLIDKDFRFETDPATGLPWTWDAARAAEFGAIDVSTGQHTVRCSTARKVVAVVYGQRSFARPQDRRQK